MSRFVDTSQLSFYVTDSNGATVVSSHQNVDAANRFIQRVTSFPSYWVVRTSVDAEQTRYLNFFVVDDMNVAYSAHQHPDAARNFIRVTKASDSFRVVDEDGRTI